MIDLESVTTFFGWCTVINIALLLFLAIWLVAFRGFTKSLHSAILGVDEGALDTLYIQFIGNYKLLITVFSLVPYLALRIMS